MMEDSEGCGELADVGSLSDVDACEDDNRQRLWQEDLYVGGFSADSGW